MVSRMEEVKGRSYKKGQDFTEAFSVLTCDRPSF